MRFRDAYSSDGDVLMAVTPAGVGVIQQGNQFVGRIFYEKNHQAEFLVGASWLAHSELCN